MPRSDLFPSHYDMCLRCREKGLDEIADFIHKVVGERDLYHQALQNISKTISGNYYSIALNALNDGKQK